MPFALKSIVTIALLTLVTACAQQEEPMEADPMVMEEEVMDKL